MTLSPDEQPLTRRELREREKQMSRKERADATRVAEEAETARRAAVDAEAQVPAPELPEAPKPSDAAAQNDEPESAPADVESEAASADADAAPSDADAAPSDADDLDASAVEDTLDAAPVLGNLDSNDQSASAAPSAAANEDSSTAPIAVSAPIPPIPTGSTGTEAVKTDDESAKADDKSAKADDKPAKTNAGPASAVSAPSFESLLSPREVVEDAVVVEDTVVVESAGDDNSSAAAEGNPFANIGAPATTEPVVEKLVFDDPAASAAVNVEPVEVPDEVPLDDPADGEPITAVTIEPAPNEPILAPLFQPNPERDLAQAGPAGATFDDLISSRPVGSTDSSTTSALVLPAVPNSSDMGTALDETGEVIITGSINLPSSMGSSGAPSAGIESNQLDALLDRSETENVEGDVAPVSASRAVSTTGTAGALVTPPKRGTANLPIILAISAGVLAVGVIGLLLVAFVFKIF